MEARTPEAVDQAFEKALLAGDLDGIVALYEAGAAMAGAPGAPAITGLEAIRGALAGFVALKPTAVNLRPRVVATVGDIAILYNDWDGKGTGADGKPMDIAGKAIEVVRRQADGTWKFIYDDAYGRG